MSLYIDKTLFKLCPKICTKNENVEISFFNNKQEKICVRIPEKKYKILTSNIGTNFFFDLTTASSAYRYSNTSPISFKKQISQQERTLFIFFAAINSSAFVPKSAMKNIEIVRKINKENSVLYILKATLKSSNFFPIYFFDDNGKFLDTHLLISNIYHGYEVKKLGTFKEYDMFKTEELVNL